MDEAGRDKLWQQYSKTHDTELRDELKKEEERLKRENDSLIGDIVRDLLGEVDADNIESFREKIQLLTGLEDSENERPKDNLQGDTGGVHSY